MSTRHSLSSSALLILVVATALPSPAADVSLEPEHQGVVEPCCASRLEPSPAPSTPRMMPEGERLDLEQRLELIQSIQSLPSLPPGTPLRSPLELFAGAPKLKKSWDGLHQSESGFSAPPDTHVAASRKTVLLAVNSALRLTDTKGRKEESTSTGDFLGLTEGVDIGNIYDPKVYFDPISDRFFFTVLGLSDSDDLGRRSSIFFALSRSSDPKTLVAPDDWCAYEIDADQGNTWSDYPGFGLNEQWMAISVNNYKFAGSEKFTNAYVYLLDREALADNRSGECPAAQFYRVVIGDDASGAPAFTVQPAQHYTESGLAGRPLFLLTAGFDTTTPTDDTYTVWRVDTDASGTPAMTGNGVTASEYTTAVVTALQEDGTGFDTGDSRMMQAAYRDGVLWGVHATTCDFGSGTLYACIRALAFDPDGPELVFEQTFGLDGVDVFWPGVAVNKKGDVVIPFQYSLLEGQLSAGFSTKKKKSDDFETVYNLQEGECSLGGENLDSGSGLLRTGDYVGAQTDPKNGKFFWIAGEWSADFGNACLWHTRVGRLKI